jgi:chromosome segregation ATPase
MITTTRRAVQTLGVLSILCLTANMDVEAQTPPSATASTDTFVTVVQRRTLEEVKADLAYIASVRTGAQTRKDRSKDELHVLEGRINTLEKDLEAIDGRLDTLDSDKDAAAYATGKQRKALLEKLKDLLETRLGVRKAEGEAAQAALGFVEAREKMCTHESALLGKKAERDALVKKGGSAAGLPQLEQSIKTMETEMLDRCEKALKAQDEWVSVEKDLVDAFRKLAEAQAAFHEQ